MPESLKHFIEKYTHLPDHDWALIHQVFRQQSFKKNELILEQGNICRFFYFFDKGLVRFGSNVDGNDVTKMFCVAPYCFTSKVSFRNQTPATESIQALENCVVWKITLDEYKKLEQINSWNIFMRKLLNEIQEFMENRLLESKVYSAEKNYENLLTRYPVELIHKIPLKHLASFLGVAPQSLSRIRSNMHNSRKS
ncbi:MAG TPA: cyclic nucleotide-binding domain-containing protein [Prolixibacteraceae bacterium]|jgi:CRP-like cAMP-binding protein|nr:cyclic nucleotide-binding domain-containing protein [Prolixibacteraceae bacterium]HPR62232.1 cyclic nucleotide-binding domain-containing protein [Prolixibacteraceae bacterium]